MKCSMISHLFTVECTLTLFFVEYSADKYRNNCFTFQSNILCRCEKDKEHMLFQNMTLFKTFTFSTNLSKPSCYLKKEKPIHTDWQAWTSFKLKAFQQALKPCWLQAGRVEMKTEKVLTRSIQNILNEWEFWMLWVQNIQFTILTLIWELKRTV